MKTVMGHKMERYGWHRREEEEINKGRGREASLGVVESAAREGTSGSHKKEQKSSR
jgi:hypothetical protein